jgi:hypothetical protein
MGGHDPGHPALVVAMGVRRPCSGGECEGDAGAAAGARLCPDAASVGLDEAAAEQASDLRLAKRTERHDPVHRCVRQGLAARDRREGRHRPHALRGDQRNFGTIRRPDGSRQPTLDRRALYTYAHEKPGQVLCNNVDNWFAVKIPHGSA